MVKLLGIALIVLCSSMTGIYMASGLSARVADIERAIAVIANLQERLRHFQPTTAELIRSAAFCVEGAAYLDECTHRMRGGDVFPAAWRAGLQKKPGALGREERELLLPLAEVLGSTGLENQLTVLDYTRERMENQLQLARRNNEKHHRLYGTLGILGGILIAIILV